MSKGSNTPIALDSNPESRVATFIRKIYNILEEQLFPEIIDWNAEGNAIVIKKPSEFGSKVLPKYFKHNHISSFIRQLNMYSFQKKRSRHAGHIYSHELFQRGQKHLLCQIKRKIKDIFPGSAHTPSQDATSQQNAQDFSSLLNENKLLKELQEKAFSKVQGLEEKLKELIMQNQILQNQLHTQKHKEPMMVSVSKMKQESGMTQPMNMIEKSEEKPTINVQYNYNQNYTVNGSMNPFAQKQYVKPEGMQVNMMYGAEALRRSEAMNAEKYVFSSQNSFAFNGFTNNKSLEAVSPSTKPSPQSSKDLSPTSEHLKHPSVEWNRPSKDMMATAEQRFVGYNEYSIVPSTVLRKRELDIEGERKALEECGIEDTTRKFLKVNPFEGHDRMSLNLGDLKKLQSNLFSSWGDKDYEQKYDGEIDLLCFE